MLRSFRCVMSIGGRDGLAPSSGEPIAAGSGVRPGCAPGRTLSRRSRASPATPFTQAARAHPWLAGSQRGDPGATMPHSSGFAFRRIIVGWTSVGLSSAVTRTGLSLVTPSSPRLSPRYGIPTVWRTLPRHSPYPTRGVSPNALFPPPRGPPNHRPARPTRQYRLQNCVELPMLQ